MIRNEHLNPFKLSLSQPINQCEDIINCQPQNFQKRTKFNNPLDKKIPSVLQRKFDQQQNQPNSAKQPNSMAVTVKQFNLVKYISYTNSSRKYLEKNLILVYFHFNIMGIFHMSLNGCYVAKRISTLIARNTISCFDMQIQRLF